MTDYSIKPDIDVQASASRQAGVGAGKSLSTHYKLEARDAAGNLKWVEEKANIRADKSWLAILVVILLLTLIPESSQAAYVAPDNYCTSVSVTPPVNTGDPYVITVTAGSGSYWRVIRYPSGPVVIPQTYDPTIPVALVGILTPGLQYQVQSAHSSGGPWSTQNCIFTAPSALGAYFEYASVYIEEYLEWQAISEPLWFQWWWFPAESANDNEPMAATEVIYSTSPLGSGVIHQAKPTEWYEGGTWVVCGYGFFGGSIVDCEEAVLSHWR